MSAGLISSTSCSKRVGLLGLDQTDLETLFSDGRAVLLTDALDQQRAPEKGVRAQRSSLYVPVQTQHLLTKVNKALSTIMFFVLVHMVYKASLNLERHDELQKLSSRLCQPLLPYW
ncbi:hypothetical protein KCU93_g415, partial [Aureobasidium melanogenum]